MVQHGTQISVREAINKRVELQGKIAALLKEYHKEVGLFPEAVEISYDPIMGSDGLIPNFRVTVEIQRV